MSRSEVISVRRHILPMLPLWQIDFRPVLRDRKDLWLPVAWSKWWQWKHDRDVRDSDLTHQFRTFASLLSRIQTQQFLQSRLSHWCAWVNLEWTTQSISTISLCISFISFTLYSQETKSFLFLRNDYSGQIRKWANKKYWIARAGRKKRSESERFRFRKGYFDACVRNGGKPKGMT